MELDRYLEDLERRLDPVIETENEAAWLRWARHENTGGDPFTAPKRPKSPSALVWPEININDALADDDMMLLMQFANVNARLENGSEFPLYVRANYGVGNIATMFGAKLYIMDRVTNTLPNVVAPGNDLSLEQLIDIEPDMDSGNGADIWRIAERFAAIREKYPKIARFVRFEQPDLQGPMDNCELLCGSSKLFYALYDDPDLIHALLGNVTDLIDRVNTRWFGMFPREDGTCSYFSHIEKGGIAIRDDSAMNLSPDMFSEFIMPYDGKLLKKYGGVVHFCGRGDHYIALLASLEGLNGVNMSQPHLNNMDTILKATADADVNLSITAPHIDHTGHNGSRILYW